MPDTWTRALRRLGADLTMRQYSGSVTHVDWVVQYDPDGGSAWLTSDVTTAGNGRSGASGNGSGAGIDADEETILVSMADLASTAIAECGVAWPRADGGGFMRPLLIDGVATWRDKSGREVPIGNLDQ